MTAQDTISWTGTGSVAVAHLTGEIDIANARSVFRYVEAGRGATTIIDLSAVTFLDSTGLKQLDVLSRRGQYRVVSPLGTTARRVLEITEFERIIPTFESVDAAVAASS